MKFLERIALSFYVVVIVFFSCLILFFVTRQADFKSIIDILSVIYFQENARLIFGLFGAGLLVLNYWCLRFIVGGQQMEKTIAFENPSGLVTVSLVALEDLVKKLVIKHPDVKDVRPSIIVRKNRLAINVRLILKSEVNIPEMTANLQEAIKRKVQDTVGLDQNIVVKVHVVRIALEDKQRRSKEDNSPDGKKEPTLALPFEGYRA